MDRFRQSQALLTKPFRPSEAGYNEIFLLATVTADKAGSVILEIDQGTPTVALHHGVRQAYGLGDTIPIVAEVQKQHGVSPYTLVSAGVHFWVAAPAAPLETLLLRRSDMPLYWTETAGRCDRDIAQACSAEGHEELLVLLKKAAVQLYRPVVIAGAEYDGDTVLRLKRKQIAAQAAQLAMQGIPSHDIDGWHAHPAPYRALPQEDGLYRQIVLVVDGQPRPPLTAMCLFDPEHNTLEIRRSVVIETQPGDAVIAVDGESFNRQVRRLTLEQAAELLHAQTIKVRPGLDMYIQHVQRLAATRPGMLRAAVGDSSLRK